MRKMLISSIALLALALCPALRAQGVNNVRVYADAPGVYISVDGNVYLTSAEFLWPSGSKHTVLFHQPDPSLVGMQLQYLGWVTNLNPTAEPSTLQPITASPGLQWVQLKFKVFYQLSIVMPDCGGASSCPGVSRVQIVKPNGCAGVYERSVTCYVERNSDVDVRAFPNAGSVFTEWRAAGGLPEGTAPTSFTLAFTMTRPFTLAPQFMPAAAANASVNVRVDPQELSIVVDGVRFTPPAAMDWGWGSVHTVGADPAQILRGVTYAFEAWSDGGPINHEVRVPSPSGPIDLVARFVPAHIARFQTSPPNLRLTIDGGQDTTGADRAWAPGSVHTISAPATQTDSLGRRYRFVSWSNGKSAAFDYTAGAAPGNLSFTATYQLFGQATIASSPSNLTIDVDGSPCATPCAVERDAGVSVRITAPASISTGDRTRLAFRGWTDSETPARTLQLSGDPQSFTVRYTAQSRVSIAATPAEGASFVIDPVSSDEFYDNGSLISVAADPALGFRILSWTGDLSGAGRRVAISVDAPKSARLLLGRVPVVAPRGIRNAALGAPASEVAPGSLISIFGANLATSVEVGPQSPLAQALGGVTLSVDGVFLPLVFVSPGQINAQLAAAVPPGEHRLLIRSSGSPDTSATVVVARNAPGLFAADDGERPTGAIFRQGGEAVTRDRPARAGDVVEMLATGLGAYATTPPDGFALGESPAYRAADHVVVVLGDMEIEPVYAGRSAAGAGLDVVRFRLPDALPDGSSAPVRIVVNDRSSNSVWLPLDR